MLFKRDKQLKHFHSADFSHITFMSSNRKSVGRQAQLNGCMSIISK